MSRPLSSAGLYARELGIRTNSLRRLGGEAYVRSLADDARALLLKTGKRDGTGKSHLLVKGGMKARGIKSCVPGICTAALSEDGKMLAAKWGGVC